VIQQQAKMLDEMRAICKRLADLQLQSTHQFVMDELMKLEPVNNWLM